MTTLLLIIFAVLFIWDMYMEINDAPEIDDKYMRM